MNSKNPTINRRILVLLFAASLGAAFLAPPHARGKSTNSKGDVIVQQPGPDAGAIYLPGWYSTTIVSQMAPDSAPLPITSFQILGNMASLTFNAGTVSGPITLNSSGQFTVVLSGSTFGGSVPFSGPTTMTLDPTTNAVTMLNVNGTFTVNGTPESYSYVIGCSPSALTPTIDRTMSGESKDPVSLATGELFTDYSPDLDLGGPLPLKFRRYYAAYLLANSVSSSLGNNWMHNFDQKLAVSGNYASVTMFRGGLVRFQQVNGAWQQIGTPRLAYQLVNVAGGGYRFLDLNDNRIYTFSATGDLTQIGDRNGNALTVTPSPSGPSQVSDGLGRTLTFSYTNGALTKVQDQTGRSVLFTNAGGNLTAVTDANGNPTSFTYSAVNGSVGLMTKGVRAAGNTPYTQTFDSFGRVASQTDSFGNRTTFSYNAGTTTLTDPLGHATQIMHNNRVDFSGYTDANGQHGSIGYDSARRRVSVTDRLGNTAKTAYDTASGYPASQTDAQGNATFYAWAAQQQNGLTFFNLTKITYADGTTETLTYYANGNVLTRTDRAGQTTAYTYNSRGQILTSTNPAGGVTSAAYNSDGTLASDKSPAGDVTSLTYDPQKRPMAIEFADGTSASFTYDALDQVLGVTDERGKTTKFAYDSNNNLKSATDALSEASTFTFDTDDLLSMSSDPLSKVTQLQFDPIGSTTAVTNPTGQKAGFSYDSLERLSSAADPSGKGPSFTYDAEGRLVASADAVTNTSKFTVDKIGRTTQAATPIGETFNISYDGLNRVVSSTDPLTQTSLATYENRGLVSSIGLPGGVTTAYSYGNLPVLTGIVDPNGGNWKRAYDNMGRLTSATDPLGQTTSFTYNSRNRLMSFTNSAGSGQMTYDAHGNLTQQKYSDGTALNYTYDDDNRITSGGLAALSYDAAGRVVASNGLNITRDDTGRIASIAYPAGSVTYAYNSRGLLSTITDWAGGVTSFAWDDARRLTSISRPNGVVMQQTYDQDSRLSGITESASGKTLASIAIQRDALGHIVVANRSLPLAPSPVPGISALTYDAAHQVSGFAYDSLGRLTKGDLNSTYTWDLASRLTAYNRIDGQASFTYDDFGQRVSRTGANGITSTFTINYALGLPSVSVVQTSGTNRYYIYMPDGSLLYSLSDATGTRKFYHFDEAGSTAFLTDDTGAITDKYGITPYGETVTTDPGNTTTDNPFTWLGRWGAMEEPGTGLYYLRYRYYDSTSARFLSRDLSDALDPLHMSPYQYADGNPVTLSDPLGLQEQTNPPSPAPAPAQPAPAPPAQGGVCPARSPLPPYQPLVITEDILLNEQRLASQDFASRWWNPIALIDFDSPTFHGNQTRPGIVNGKGVAVQNQVDFHGRLIDYGEFNYYYTATYYEQIGVPRAVEVAGTYIYNIIAKGQLPTENQIIASNEGYWDSKEYHSLSRAPVERTVIDLTPVKNAIASGIGAVNDFIDNHPTVSSVAKAVGDFILDHPTISKALDWLCN